MKEAQSKIQTFMDIKENVKPTFCHCFEEGILYSDRNYRLNSNNSVSFSTRSAARCQTKCKSQENCKFWSFINDRKICRMFDENAIQTLIVDENHDKKDIISGPKICQSHFTFCCGLGYGSSVTITFFIVFLSVVIFYCCCCFKINLGPYAKVNGIGAIRQTIRDVFY